MNVKITEITTKNIKTHDDIDASKVNEMLLKLVKNLQGYERVSLVKPSVSPSEMNLYVNIPYIRACAYDYPFMPCEVFSVNKMKNNKFYNIKQRYYD